MTATLTPRTHPFDSALLDYAMGRLNDGATLLVAAHLSMCPSCRQRMQRFEAKAGLTLEDMPLEQMETHCLENLLQKIDEHGPPACIDVTIPLHAPAPGMLVPEPLHDYLGPRLEAAHWVAATSGVFTYRAPKQLPLGMVLYRFSQGAAIPLRGSGMLLILQGEIHTLLHTHGPGDIVKNTWLPSLGRTAYRELIGLMG